MTYELMNKDRVIAIVEVTKNFVGVTEFKGTIPYYIGNLAYWIDGRTSPVGRANVELMLKLAGIRNKEEYLSITHGISLIDTLWFRKLGDRITWDKISPYRNRFSRIISEICLNGEFTHGGNFKSPSPDYKVGGSIDKCWRHINNGIYLYKTAGECWSGLAGLRPYMEYYASQIADALIDDKSHFIGYGISVSNTRDGYRKPYVYSRIFTDEYHGLVEYGDSRFKKITLGEYDSKCNNIRDRVIIREMLLLDSIILNCDRHNGNYGFIVNNDNYEKIGFAPIYDNDCSLGFNISIQSSGSIQKAYENALMSQPKAEMGNYIEQARWAMTKKLYNKLLELRNFKFKRLPKQIDVADDRIEFMEYIVHNQINSILSTYRVYT